ncbi:MAG: pyridoxal-phosphate dependent enzyme [Methylococcales bacterium]|nr:pyridoxal-phosphate dependent enzyme [Methylococcales bacterium]
MHPKLVELEKQFNKSTLTPLFSPLLEQKKIELWIKRDDLIHPVISGNKWRKLKYILDDALTQKKHSLISMGGTYSNHLHALAFAAMHLKFKTKGFIRGERPVELNPTLEDIVNWGMELQFVSRSEYKKLRKFKEYNELPGLQKGEYWLPEGGSTELALKGVGEIVAEIGIDTDFICVPCGTATTLAGLVKSVENDSQVMGFSALKGGSFLVDEVNTLFKKKLLNKVNWTIQLDYHFGGFAKRNNELLLFIERFEKQHNIEIEPIYTGKMLYGLFDLVQQDYFKPGQTIVAIHTGGLQGSRMIL